MFLFIHLYRKAISMSHSVGIRCIFVEPMGKFLFQFKETFLRVGVA